MHARLHGPESEKSSNNIDVITVSQRLDYSLVHNKQRTVSY